MFNKEDYDVLVDLLDQEIAWLEESGGLPEAVDHVKRLYALCLSLRGGV